MAGWNLADLFEAVADCVGDREAIVAGSERLTFTELDRRANRLAHTLRRLGVGPGDRVAIQLRNRPAHLESILAAFKLRAVPINVHHRYTTDELRYLLDDAEPTVLIHESDLARIVRSASEARPGLACIEAGAAYEQALAQASATRPVTPDRSGTDRYIIYTGGTTGLPKGVIWTHENLLFGALGGTRPDGRSPKDLADAAALARSGRSRCLPASPFNHGTAQWAALATLFGGGTVVMSDPGPMRAGHLWDLAEKEAVSLLVVVGDAFALPLADALEREPDRWDLSHLLSIISGGAMLSSSVRDRLLRHLPWTVVVDGYGTSESGGHGRMAVWPGQPEPSRRLFTIGPDTAVFDQDHRRVEPGSAKIGYLARRGRIPIGYHNDPERTALTFPVIDGERWAMPGDLAEVVADGRVILLGRGTSSINSGGEKVYPDEVEATLKAHPDVFDTTVIGTADPRFGEAVTAIIQLRPGCTADPETLVEHCRRHLAGFKAPRRFEFVDLLVRKPTGKPDYVWARRLVGESEDHPSA